MPVSVVIINSIVCLIGAAAGVLFASGSIISIANMTVPWAGFLLVVAMLVPVMFVISGIGAWLAYAWASSPVLISLIALPWVYIAVFVLLMLVSFKA